MRQSALLSVIDRSRKSTRLVKAREMRETPRIKITYRRRSHISVWACRSPKPTVVIEVATSQKQLAYWARSLGPELLLSLLERVVLDELERHCESDHYDQKQRENQRPGAFVKEVLDSKAHLCLAVVIAACELT